MVKFIPKETASELFVVKNSFVTTTLQKVTILINLEKDPIYFNSLDFDFAAWMAGSNDASAFFSIQYVPDGDNSIDPGVGNAEVKRVNRVLDTWNVGLGATASGSTAFLRKIRLKQMRKLNKDDRIEFQYVGFLNTNIIKFNLAGFVRYSGSISVSKRNKR